MTTHTETQKTPKPPYRVVKGIRPEFISVVAVDSVDRRVFTASTADFDDTQAEATAADLVHRFNSFPALLAALEALAGDEWRMSCDWGPSAEREPIIAAARAAIAAAKAP